MLSANQNAEIFACILLGNEIKRVYKGQITTFKKITKNQDGHLTLINLFDTVFS